MFKLFNDLEILHLVVLLKIRSKSGLYVVHPLGFFQAREAPPHLLLPRDPVLLKKPEGFWFYVITFPWFLHNVSWKLDLKICWTQVQRFR